MTDLTEQKINDYLNKILDNKTMPTKMDEASRYLGKKEACLEIKSIMLNGEKNGNNNKANT